MLYCNRETRDKPQLLFLFMINQFKKMENINKVLKYLTMCPWYMIPQRDGDEDGLSHVTKLKSA